MLIVDMPSDILYEKCLRCCLRGTKLCKEWCADGERKQEQEMQYEEEI